MTALDQIAPYPKTEAEVTADKLARSFAVHAQVHWRMAIDHPDRDKAYESGLWVGQYFTLTFLLRELQQRAGRTAADEVARNLWAEIDAVDSIGGWVWNWLDGYGINQAKVNEIADKAMADSRTGRDRLEREVSASEQERALLAVERDALKDYLDEIAALLGVPDMPGRSPAERWGTATRKLAALVADGLGVS